MIAYRRSATLGSARLVRYFFLGLGLICVGVARAGTPGSPGDATADAVLGQTSMTTNAIGSGPAGVHGPVGIAIDASSTPERLYVADTQNNRVLGWADAVSFSNGAPADIVIGQPDFNTTVCSDGRRGDPPPNAGTLCFPYAVAVDGNGNLYVGDTLTYRALEYDNPFATCTSIPCVGPAAKRVFGQPDFTSSVCGAGPDGLCGASAVALDSSGDLYVADAGTSRVLEYDQPLAPGGGTPGVPGSAGDTTADLTFGNSASTTNFPCVNLSEAFLLGVVPEDALCSPASLAVDNDGNLYIGDVGYNRVLEYDNPLAPGGGTPHVPGSAGDTTADRVFGEPSFTASVCSGGGSLPAPVTADTLCAPYGIAVDQYGNLYISDEVNARVLEYNIPLKFDTSEPGTGDNTADNVFGQPGFVTDLCAGLDEGSPTTADGLCFPSGLATDAAGNLFVADTLNNRMLRYDVPLPPPGPSNQPPPVALRVDPGKLTFRQLFSGPETGSSRPRKITLSVPPLGRKNPLGEPFLIDFAASGPFAIDRDTTSCASGMVLHPGQNCSIGVTFTPDQFGLQMGSLSVGDLANNAPQTVVLRGNGLSGPPLIFQPEIVDFGPVTIGGTGFRKLTIINPLDSYNFGLSTITDPDEFSVTDIYPVLGRVAKVVVTLSFTPTKTGLRRARLSTFDQSTQVQRGVPLTGVGVKN